MRHYTSAGVQVTIADLLTNVSVAADDTITFLGVSATSANGGIVATNKGWVFYTPATGFTNTDTFTYLVTDGWTAPVAGTVTVAVTVGTEPSRNLVISNLGSGSVAIGGQGIPGTTYTLQCRGYSSIELSILEGGAGAPDCPTFRGCGKNLASDNFVPPPPLKPS